MITTVHTRPPILRIVYLAGCAGLLLWVVLAEPVLGEFGAISLLAFAATLFLAVPFVIGAIVLSIARKSSGVLVPALIGLAICIAAVYIGGWKEERLVAQLKERGVRLAESLNAYRKSHGNYPKSLQVLAESGDPAIKYELKKNQFLYTLDNGRPGLRFYGTGLNICELRFGTLKWDCKD